MPINELSLRMKILLTSALLLLAVATFSLTIRAIKEFTPYIQFSGMELIENSTTGYELKTVKDAFDFVKSIESNGTLTLQDLKSNPECGGYEYGIYINNKNIKYVICQNGKYQKYKPVPFGIEQLRERLNLFLDNIEKASREFITR